MLRKNALLLKGKMKVRFQNGCIFLVDGRHPQNGVVRTENMIKIKTNGYFALINVSSVRGKVALVRELTGLTRTTFDARATIFTAVI